MSLPVAILAGGLATRLWPMTQTIPKSLLDVGGRPFAEHQLDLLRRHGITDVVFLVGYLGEMLRDALGDGSRWGITVRYVFDGPKQMGTGGALARALPALGDPFLVLYGDSYLECDYGAIANAFLASGKSGLMTVYRNEDRFDRSNVHFADGEVVAYDKGNRTPEMRHIDYGLGAFRHSAFAGWPANEPFDLAALYNRLLDAGDLAACEVPDRFYEIGSLEGLEETRARLAARGTTRS